MKYKVAIKNKGRWICNGFIVECKRVDYEHCSSALYRTGHTSVAHCDEFSVLKNGAVVFGHGEAGQIYKLIPLSKELQHLPEGQT